ncbi:MAG: GNAT family N-acetyltransferase [Lautropia sp.]|nr:GNAT family N-acetyltransferase [Lautropia sp.]
MQLVFRKFRARNFADYLRLAGEARVMAMVTGRALSLDEARCEFAEVLRGNGRHPQLGTFRVLDAGGRFLGLGKLLPGADDEGRAELGYMLLPHVWGQGIGSAIAADLLARAAAHGITEVFAIIDPANLPSRRILLRQGFAHRQYRDFDGLPGEVLDRRLDSVPWPRTHRGHSSTAPYK